VSSLPLLRPGIVLLLGALLAIGAMAQTNSFINHLQKAKALHKQGELSKARTHAVSARKAASSSGQRKEADSLLDDIERAIIRRQAAERLAKRLANEAAPAEATKDYANDVALDQERLSQTLLVFTRDQGGKVLEGTLSEFQCRGANPRLVVNCRGESVAIEVDEPGNILITHAGEHTEHFDFRCGKQKAQAVRVGYRPANKDGHVGFLRILEFQAQE
jgi:hypothetical protein